MFKRSQTSSLVKWLIDMLPHLSLSLEASEEELRECLIDGAVLCSILDKLCPGSVEVEGSSQPVIANVERFLAAMDELGLPSFEPSDLEQGSMVPVLQCLSTLRTSFSFSSKKENVQNNSRKIWDTSQIVTLEGTDSSREDTFVCEYHSDSTRNGEETSGNLFHSRFQDARDGHVISGPSVINRVADEFLEEPPVKQGCLDGLLGDNMLELIKSMNNATLRSLFKIVNGILDDSIERKSGDVSYNVAHLLRKVVQVIEQRIFTQAENLKNQNNLFKAREEKYRFKLRVLETLAVGTTEENEVVANQLQQMKAKKCEIEEKKKNEEQDLMALKKQKDHSDHEVLMLKHELEKTKNAYENHCLQSEVNAKQAEVKFEKKLNELECLLKDSGNKLKELETSSESKSYRWRKKERIYQNFIDSQIGALQELRVALESLKYEALKTKRSCSEELNILGLKLKGLADAAQNYHAALLENRRLYNEVQDLKGNIRVYCRIRPFLPGQSKKQTTIEYIGENGELVITNPSKQGKDSRRLFKFNKVFGPASSQEEIFLDTQPLIRSVLDGYNVCIFAYGQTGSGKTYTMSGPNVSLKEEWGVNYRALHDLFQISQSRNSIAYEVGVQMVEIYNEQVRDLLSSEGPQKRLGIWNTTQPNGLAVPDASMYPVKSTADVLELMDIGLMNRAVGATALNERSSRSHSVLTVHVRGTDLETDAILRGNLHLVDLAGSERVDRSEATGDRLKEAQHINKSLSALGDVIFALAQKSAHVPYRNSKLTQLLQSSLGGQAKTLMFVQLNPDVDSYSETRSTLKFAERVSGVELGAARSNKEGKYVRELMEQVAALKDTIANKDAEIERLQLLKANNVNGMNRNMSSLRYGSSSPRRHSSGTPSPRPSQRPSGGKESGVGSDLDNCSEYSDKHSESGSHQSVDGFRHIKDLSSQSMHGGEVGQNLNEDTELLGFGDADSEERLSDISDGGLSMGTETDGSISSVVEYTLFPEVAETSENTKVDTRQLEKLQFGKTPAKMRPSESIAAENTPAAHSERLRVPSKLPRPPKILQTKPPESSVTRSSSKLLPSNRKSYAGSSSSMKPLKRWQ